MKNKLKEITEQYFSSFESKDIMSLEKLFDKEIKLFDPVIKEVIGIKLLRLTKISLMPVRKSFLQKKIFM